MQTGDVIRLVAAVSFDLTTQKIQVLGERGEVVSPCKVEIKKLLDLQYAMSLSRECPVKIHVTCLIRDIKSPHQI